MFPAGPLGAVLDGKAGSEQVDLRWPRTSLVLSLLCCLLSPMTCFHDWSVQNPSPVLFTFYLHFHFLLFFPPEIIILMCWMCLFIFHLYFFRATPTAYGSSQARDQIRAAGTAYTTAIATQDPNHICDLHHSSQQGQIPNPLSRARNWTHILMNTSQIRFSTAPQREFPECVFLKMCFCKMCCCCCCVHIFWIFIHVMACPFMILGDSSFGI